jgi:hypothetical protein
VLGTVDPTRKNEPLISQTSCSDESKCLREKKKFLLEGKRKKRAAIDARFSYVTRKKKVSSGKKKAPIDAAASLKMKGSVYTGVLWDFRRIRVVR